MDLVWIRGCGKTVAAAIDCRWQGWRSNSLRSVATATGGAGLRSQAFEERPARAGLADRVAGATLEAEEITAGAESGC